MHLKHALAGTAIVLTALLLAGCTGGGSARSDNGGVSQGSPERVSPNDADNPGADSADKNSADKSAEKLDRSVVTTGTVSLTVDKPTDASASAQRIVDTAGGRVDAITERPGTSTQRASASLSLRIPSSKLDSTLAALKKLGTVDSIQTSADDLTTQVTDVDARVTALQTSVDRLVNLMSKASDTADLITIESALSQRQADLDSLKAQQSALKDQVSLATITLELHSKGAVTAAGPGDFFSGLAAGWESLVSAGGAFLVFLGIALPWLLLFAVIGAIAWGIVRLALRRKRGNRLDA